MSFQDEGINSWRNGMIEDQEADYFKLNWRRFVYQAKTKGR